MIRIFQHGRTKDMALLNMGAFCLIEWKPGDTDESMIAKCLTETRKPQKLQYAEIPALSVKATAIDSKHKQPLL